MSEKAWKLVAVATWATAGLAWSFVAWVVRDLRKPPPVLARKPEPYSWLTPGTTLHTRAMADPIRQPPRATVTTPAPRSLPS